MWHQILRPTKRLPGILLAGLLLSLATPLIFAQNDVGYVKLFVKANNDSLTRKHFYLSSKPIDIDALYANPNVGAPPTLNSYLQEVKDAGDLTAYIDNWLAKYSCETVYCRSMRPEDLTIPQFREAYDKAKALFGNAPDANAEGFRWMNNFLAQDLRTGYYDRRRAWLKKAVAALGITLNSAVTDENGNAYFTNLSPGTYYVSNLLPVETAKGCFLWNNVKEKLEIKAGEKKFYLSDTRNRVDLSKVNVGGKPVAFRCGK